jgi:catechol 2,3-dioxygenase-like lactoylglutathione lyase family enzyme
MTSVTPQTADTATFEAEAVARRKKNRILGLHHHAYLVRDMEETRHFYEDILGMPLVGTWVERTNPVTGQPDNYSHLFFELADGSALAFFQFKSEQSNRDQALNAFADNNPFAHHIALHVDGEDVLKDYQARLKTAGVASFATDHGYCRSLYFHDPSGMQIEMTTNVPETVAMMGQAARDAHELLKNWMAEDDVPTNNTRRGDGWVKSDA